MGLTFSVANPTDVFTEPFGSVVADLLRSQFGDSINLASPLDTHYTDELGWSGWRMLQERAVDACGADAIPHFLSMEAWHGVYLPVDTKIRSFEFPDESTPLDVACLDNLISELEAIGAALNLPTDDAALQQLAAKYLEDDDLIDEDLDIQTFAELLPCARLAKQRNQPLWVVK